MPAYEFSALCTLVIFITYRDAQPRYEFCSSIHLFCQCMQCMCVHVESSSVIVTQWFCFAHQSFAHKCFVKVAMQCMRVYTSSMFQCLQCACGMQFSLLHVACMCLCVCVCVWGGGGGGGGGGVWQASCPHVDPVEMYCTYCERAQFSLYTVMF